MISLIYSNMSPLKTKKTKKKKKSLWVCIVVEKNPPNNLCCACAVTLILFRTFSFKCFYSMVAVSFLTKSPPAVSLSPPAVGPSAVQRLDGSTVRTYSCWERRKRGDLKLYAVCNSTPILAQSNLRGFHPRPLAGVFSGGVCEILVFFSEYFWMLAGLVLGRRSRLRVVAW